MNLPAPEKPMALAALMSAALLATAAAPADTLAPRFQLGDGPRELGTRELGGSPREGAEDYLLHPPVLTATARGGVSLPSGGSDFFDFVTEELTLERDDFRSALVGVDLAVHLSARADLTLGVAHTRRTAHSRYRHQDERLEQWTRLQQTPLTVGMRVFPFGRGRQVGEFVWIPSSLRPYLGGAVGAISYRLTQDGEWVDAAADEDLPLEERVFEKRFQSEGWGRLLQAVAGVELGVTPRFAVALEARYQAGSAALGGEFEGFEPLDLGGAVVTAGLSYAF